MKEVRTKIALAKVKTVLEVLNISREDIKSIMLLIEAKMNKSEVEIKQPKLKDSIREKKVTGMKSIISILTNNPEEMYSIERISKESGVTLRTARNYVKQLRDSKKVKIVGYNMDNKGPATILYQSYRSPLKALRVVTPEKGYDSIHNFVKNNKGLFEGLVTPSSFAFVVEQEGLTVYPMLLGVGIVRGYKTSELKKLAQRVYNPVEKRTKRKYTKRTIKAKRKYTRRTKTEPDEIPMELTVKKNFNILTSLFKRKEKNSDLIKF